ncbi:LHFPL tetraspan subfamily member 1 protein-like [Cloeon dipterum]|uniref:LHFPL tetraspan subfamily member 6 protein n=2 Tax=Cloeon dipterum TaxID=197152 RepID=A0A8S1DFT1_9INSE|nr:Hypothetical predicted protein [Cloeon dipterum]
MATSLTALGILWAFLSLVSALACSTGFYLPYWIKGELTKGFATYFGSFRRCNYPVLNDKGQIELLEACGRYSTFADIPSPWWQATTVLVGVGSGLSLLLAVTACAACCISYLIHGRMAKIVGFFQFLSAVLIAVGVALYPLGWDNIEVQQACGGQSKPYQLGPCEFSYSAHLLVGGTVLLLVCSTLSCKASRLKPGSFRV